MLATTEPLGLGELLADGWDERRLATCPSPSCAVTTVWRNRDEFLDHAAACGLLDLLAERKRG